MFVHRPHGDGEGVTPKNYCMAHFIYNCSLSLCILGNICKLFNVNQYVLQKKR